MAGLDTQHERVYVTLVPSLSVQKGLQHVSYELITTSSQRCYTPVSVRTLVARWFATIGMVPRFATVSRPRGSHYPGARERRYDDGCVTFCGAWTGNNNRFADVELVASGAPQLAPDQFFPPGRDFTS